MGNYLEGLVSAYYLEIERLRACSRLGQPSARKGILPAKLPTGTINEIHSRTKNRRAIGVVNNGSPHVIAAPASWPVMRRITCEFVDAGGHPDDLLVWDYDPDADSITAIRTATEHLLWTASDQYKLETP